MGFGEDELTFIFFQMQKIYMRLRIYLSSQEGFRFIELGKKMHCFMDLYTDTSEAYIRLLLLFPVFWRFIFCESYRPLHVVICECRPFSIWK